MLLYVRIEYVRPFADTHTAPVAKLHHSALQLSADSLAAMLHAWRPLCCGMDAVPLHIQSDVCRAFAGAKRGCCMERKDVDA